MHKIYKYFFGALFFCFLCCIIFFIFLFGFFKNGKIVLFNQVDEILVGEIEFFQQKNLLYFEKFEISQNEQKTFIVPDNFNEGDVKISIEGNFGKEEFIISNDYLYSFNVNEEIFIKKENEEIKLEKNPYN